MIKDRPNRNYAVPGWSYAGKAGILGAVLLLAGLLAGCASSTIGARAASGDVYVVRRGDTLYSIGQSEGINWHQLARWNHIQPPYRLRVGQQLVLHSPSGSRSRTSTGSNRAARTTPTPARQTEREENSISSAANTAKTRQTTVKAGGPGVDGWHWPVSGKIIRKYDPASRNHGIEISGKEGSPIHAASSGQIVYNGQGLKGYGHLIIIKHDEHYLSAYGFLKKSLVSEGQTVKAGQNIAEMGMGPGNKPMLLFEIRRDGKPLNPQSLLPGR